MQNKSITKEVLHFLKKLEKNNTREWFTENKKTFKIHETAVKAFYNHVLEQLKN